MHKPEDIRLVTGKGLGRIGMDPPRKVWLWG